MGVSVHPATADRWNDLGQVFGKRGDDPGWCWCQLFLGASGKREAGADNRSALHTEITYAAIPPGLIAYVDEDPAGWTRIGPRSGFPGVTENRALARVLDRDGATTWWVACFAIARPYRGMGVATALLQSAVELARVHGARAVEGHPVDVAGFRSARVAGSALFTGTKTLFSAAGFVEVARTSTTRPVMRLAL